MTGKQDRPIGELFSELGSDIATLLRHEIALARTEISDKVRRVGKNATSLVLGGALAYAALLVLMGAIVILLNGFMPLWAAALIVAVVTGAIGGAMASTAIRNLKQIDLAPAQTVQTLKEDATWMKQQIK